MAKGTNELFYKHENIHGETLFLVKFQTFRLQLEPISSQGSLFIPFEKIRHQKT